MEIYFLKSAACLAFLMIFYKLLLEREDMHVFKRFYLLGAVLVSFLIPWISFTSYVDTPAATSGFLITTEPAEARQDATEGSAALPLLLWTVYALGMLFFSIKFFRNLQEILQKIRKNPQVNSGDTTKVLLKEEVAPHTFWRFIFLNFEKYNQGKIPSEVFEHERAHAVQRHSLDILVIELLQVVFWFHPLLYLVKPAIKLNHEFLADRAVIRKGVKTSTYQETLLAYSSGAANSSFVNSINYPSIKKRFTVMKTTTSKRAFLGRSLLLLPLLAVLLYGFSTRKTEFKDPNTITSEITDYQTLEISVDEKGIVKMEGKQVTLAEMRKNLKPETFTNYAITASPTAPKEVMEELLQIVLALKVEGSVTVCSSGGDDLNGKNVVHELFKNVEEQEKATPKMIVEYNQWAKHYKVAGSETMAVVKPVLDRMKYIYSIMTPEQRKKAEPFPNLDPEQVIAVIEDEQTSAKQNSGGDVPPPPPPPPAPTVRKEVDVPAPPAPPAPETAEGQVPPPPPPPSPVEAMEDWIEEGAKFFYNGKSITGKEALEIVKENNGKNLQVNVKEDSTGKTVKLFDKRR